MRLDFTNKTKRNGWNITSCEIVMDCIKGKYVEVAGLGFIRDIDDRDYILDTDTMILTFPDGDAEFEILKITYKSDPYDYFYADIKFIGYVTGMRSFFNKDLQKTKLETPYRGGY